jgi:hypothetical protein
MALSDTARWEALRSLADDINKKIQDLRGQAKAEGFVVMDRGGSNDVNLIVYGRGMKYGWKDKASEVWQDSTSCSEQGTERIADTVYRDDKVITDVPGEDLEALTWKSSSYYC